MELSARDSGYRLPEIDCTFADVSAQQAVYSAVSQAESRTLLDILRKTISAHPDASAIDDGDVVLSYRQLDHEVTKLVRQLRKHGVGVGDRVGIRLPSGSARLYLAILAVLIAGAAYVPVDADDPDERAELVWEQAGVCVVLRAASAA